MSDDHQPQPCKRPGCRFERRYEQSSAGGYRRRTHCGGPCWVWCARARKVAASEGPQAEAEAAELLRLSALLDARKGPAGVVPGLYVDAATRRF